MAQSSKNGLIDTHNHLDCSLFDADRSQLVKEAKEAGISDAILCAGFIEGFQKTRETAHAFHLHYALGIHPLYLPQERQEECQNLIELENHVLQALPDPLFVAIGEIGLDGYVKTLDWATQQRIFFAQLRLARDLDLPVSVHARHAVDAVSAGLRRYSVNKGVIHAFNGSLEQAQRLINLGMKLGFGGALLYSGSKRIRRVFCALDSSDFVLETDCPDMPSPSRRMSSDSRTHPADMADYAREAALLRGVSVQTIIQQSRTNALAAFPRLDPHFESNDSEL